MCVDPVSMSAMTAALLGGSTAAAGTAATAGTIGAGAAAASTASAAALGGIELASIPLMSAAASTPAWMGYTSLAMTGLSGAAGAYGAIQSAEAQAASDRFNAQVADINAKQAERNAQLTSEAGNAEVAMQGRKNKATVGSIKANQAGSGISVNDGSALDVRTSAAELGQLDALTIRSNATKEAYSYGVQQTSFENQSNLENFSADAAEKAGAIGAGSTLLGAASEGFANYAKYKSAGGFNI